MPRTFCTSLLLHLHFLQCCYFIQAHIISSSSSHVFHCSCSLCFHHTLQTIHPLYRGLRYSATHFRMFGCATELCACRAQSYLYREQVSIRNVKVLYTECQTRSNNGTNVPPRCWCVRFILMCSSMNSCFGAHSPSGKIKKPNWFIVA